MSFRLALLLTAFLVGLGLTATETVRLTTGSWQPAGELAGERSGSSAALLVDGRVLFTGGSDAAGPTFDAEIYDPATGFFTSVASLSVARGGHSSTMMADGRVLVAGGRGSDGEAVASAEIYDPASDQWAVVVGEGEMLEARAGHTATLLVDGRVLVAGGENAGGALASAEIFDPAAGVFSAWGSLAGPRSGHAAARLADGRVLIVGGSDGAGSLASSEIFDPEDDTISGGPALTTPRSGHSATTLLNGDVLVAGGSDGFGELGSAEIYGAALGAFVPLGSGLQSARQGHLAFLLPANHSVLIVGGAAEGQALASAELYRPWSDAFVPTGWLHEPRAAAAGAAWEGGVVVGGGEGSATSEAYGFATLRTDKDDYAPGDYVTITGSGWQPGREVTLWLREEPLSHEDHYLTAVADGNGDIFNDDYRIEDHDFGVRFFLTGSDDVSEAQITFTDARVWSLTISPTSGVASQTQTYGLVAANNSSAGEELGCVKVTIPSQFTPVGSPTTSTPNWTVSRSGQEVTAVANSNGARRSPGQTAAFSQQATAPGSTSGSPFTWTGTAFSNLNCSSQAFPVPSAPGQPAVAVTARSTSASVSLSPASVVIGQASTISVTVTDTATGTKSFPAGTVALSSSVGSDVFGAACVLTSTATPGVSTCSSSVTPATASVHTITASFSATALHASSSGNAGLTVNKIDQTITFGALGGKTFGDPAFAVSATASSGLAVSFSGLTPAVCTVSGSTVTIVAAGTCTIRASQAGNATYNPAPDVDQSFLVAKATPTATLQVNNSPQTYDGGPKAAAVGIVSSSVPGSVSNVQTGGAASQTNAGTYPVTADFVPTDSANYNSLIGISAGSFTIGKAATVTEVTCGAGPFVYDGTAHEPCSASVSGPGGLSTALTVVYADNVDAGTATASASYAESANYLGSSDSASFSIGPASTTTTVTNAAALASTPTVVDESYAVNWSVTVDAPGGGTPTGTVTVSGGSGCSAPVAAGTCSVTSTSAGSKSLVATYVSDSANFNGSASSGTTHQVDTRPSSTGVSLSPASVVVGQSSSVTVTVGDSAGAGTPSAPTGTITVGSSVGSGVFSSTSCTLAPAGPASSSCSVTVTPSSASVHTISVSYGGSGVHSGSGGGAGLTVSPAATTTSLGAAPSPSAFGALVTFTATVTVDAPGAGAPTGSVTFKQGATVLAAGVPLVAGQASFTISSLTAGLHTITAEYGGSSDFNGSSGSKAHDVGQAATISSVSVTPNPHQQYSDRVTFVATLSPTSIEGLAPASSVTFKIGTQTMGTVGLVVDGGVLRGTLASVPLLEPSPFGTPPTGQLEPGVRTVTAVFGGVDPNFAVVSPTASLTITREDASADYTGADYVSTACATCSNATVTLAATVRDISVTSPADANPGDIRNARVDFVNLDAGSALLCSAPVGLVSAGDPKVGTATCNWSTSIGAADSLSVTVGVVVKHYYTGKDETVVTISKPINNMITGGGYLVLSGSAGIKAGDLASKNNWGFNVKYNKSGKNLQGNINAIVRRTEGGVLRVYQIKGNAMNSLSVNNPPGGPGTAIFNGKANLTDITDPTSPIPVDGNATLQVTMTDRGEPGSNDSIALTVWDKNGGMWFSSHWNGIQTVEKLLGGGNLVVR